MLVSTKIWAFALCSPGTQTEACETFNTGRWSRLLRQEFQAQETASRARLPAKVWHVPAEAMMQASVVAGIIACRDELGFPGRSRV